jgi:hypothetical protein
VQADPVRGDERDALKAAAYPGRVPAEPAQ